MKAKVNNNVNQTVKNLSFNAAEPLAKFLKLARMGKEKHETPHLYNMKKFDISQEDYELFSDILRLTGNADIPVSAYVEAVVHDFLMTHDEEGMKQFAEKIIKEDNN